MYINGVEIEDTFAEAFKMRAARLIITAANEKWALTAAQVATGFATSVIACGAEAGIEGTISANETPDGRPGVSILVFTMGPKAMEDQLMRRVGQCIMTCPTTACFNGLESEEKLKIGGSLRYFGDGFQISKLIGGRRFWRIPVMESEFLVEESFGIKKAIGGGNFLILGESQQATLEAAERAVEAMREVRGVVMPFPGGIVRSGSKTTSRYKFLRASTNTAYCPTIRRQTESALPEGVNSVLEIVIDGLNEWAIREAMRVGIRAACRPGVVRISAGNYGGTLGQYQFHLREVVG
ncbi:MAG: formylmethanofuran--tetrahydromethanopterin N-formyltransferase [Anaerolineae bacterium]|jgi:formylmethanofuran--tetrahydromethanopterin N-formyltransferase|nr:formylmethanofuran--tetrahydromethanopterin N-formyltransferase [Anaerolineae bacterium]MDH7474345.1 formylmethanofuran--tetrahydromethanopterin N-formyltransferase [Anaerolineae bacterium]